MDGVERETPDFKTYNLPLARIKKVMKSDEEVKMISAEGGFNYFVAALTLAPIMFSKACESEFSGQAIWEHYGQGEGMCPCWPTILRSRINALWPEHTLVCRCGKSWYDSAYMCLPPTVASTTDDCLPQAMAPRLLLTLLRHLS